MVVVYTSVCITHIIWWSLVNEQSSCHCLVNCPSFHASAHSFQDSRQVSSFHLLSSKGRISYTYKAYLNGLVRYVGFISCELGQLWRGNVGAPNI
ncbi:hypothetical protein PVAP13_3NG174971 [Panicum virgatum]|uniref:Uncharacterized protein n=1 Tax=Panicum virgatum TaxID=38727 RepID=A0A8T0U8B3_PANVG|nr:hypothetical protein PVAP13_3NG174971 [Panicum virgatum]